MVEALEDLIAICRKTDSFGSTLSGLMIEKDVSQKELAWRIQRSKSDISRLINDSIPDKFEMREVEQIATALGCEDVQFARLVRAFACHILRQRGLW
jgi:hypothetical protein